MNSNHEPAVDTRDWVRGWNPTPIVAWATPVPNGLTGAHNALSGLCGHPQPFTLTWNGSHYVPDFVPTDIKVTAYTEEQYTALENAYLLAKNDAIMYRVAEKEVMRLKGTNLSLCERIDYLTEKTLALQHLWSAKKYLLKVHPKDFSSQFVIADAINSIRSQEVDQQAIISQLDRIDETGHLKVVATETIKWTEDSMKRLLDKEHVEERSI